MHDCLLDKMMAKHWPSGEAEKVIIEDISEKRAKLIVSKCVE